MKKDLDKKGGQRKPNGGDPRIIPALLTLPMIVGVLLFLGFAASAAALNRVILADRVIPVAVSSSGRSTVTVDDTLEYVRILTAYDGSIGDVAIALLDSLGSDTGIAFSCGAGVGRVKCSATLDSAWIATNGVGDYVVQATNRLGTDVDVAVFSIASPGADGTYYLAVSISHGENVVGI